MVLKDKESGFDTLTAMSIKGRSHSLMDLTVRTLQFLENFAITKVSGGFGGTVNPLRDVQWVLTVPAIWNDFGKAFMRKAAFKAGLIEEEQSDNLLLVLEPEGASLAVHVGAAQHGLLGAGSRFMVLDCGGGTVDITVHQVLTVQPLTMKAVAAPTGGDWGGDYVNMEFKKFLAELLGPDLFKEQDLPLEFYSIYRDFDKIKVVYDAEVDPPAIRVVDVLDNKKQLVELAAAYNSKHPDKPILNTAPQRNGFLTMSKELMLSFFEPSLRATVQATRTVLAETPGIRHIIVVGGFGSSKVLTTRVCSEFHNRGGVVVVLPASHPKPQGAIVQGAVYFGLHKDIMQSRVAAHTYGVAMRDPENTSDIFSVLVSDMLFVYRYPLRTAHSLAFPLSCSVLTGAQGRSAAVRPHRDRLRPAAGEHADRGQLAYLPLQPGGSCHTDRGTLPWPADRELPAGSGSIPAKAEGCFQLRGQRDPGFDCERRG
jgi:hypothetical protein